MNRKMLIFSGIQKAMKSNEVLIGIVLSGGKSSRMKKDKSQINYRGKPHNLWLAELLSRFCNTVFLSVAKAPEKEGERPFLVDKYSDIGPLAGLLTAFERFPNNPLFVLACDLALISKFDLQNLVTSRASDKIATCYQSAVTGEPEPLISIWEPKAKDILLEAYQKKDYSLKQVLLDNDYHSVPALSKTSTINVNTPREEIEARLQLNRALNIDDK